MRTSRGLCVVAALGVCGWKNRLSRSKNRPPPLYHERPSHHHNESCPLKSKWQNLRRGEPPQNLTGRHLVKQRTLSVSTRRGEDPQTPRNHLSDDRLTRPDLDDLGEDSSGRESSKGKSGTGNRHRHRSSNPLHLSCCRDDRVLGTETEGLDDDKLNDQGPSGTRQDPLFTTPPRPKKWKKGPSRSYQPYTHPQTLSNPLPLGLPSKPPYVGKTLKSGSHLGKDLYPCG